MRVKKLFVYLLALLCLLSSCKNFFNGQDFLTDLDNAIDYQNSQTYVIQVKAAEGTGTIIAGMGNNDCKVTDSLAIGFQKNTGYDFIEWRAVSKTDEKTSRSDYVSFKDKAALETTVTLVQGADDILIIPVCDKTFKIEKALPEDKDGGVCCDSTIQLKFTYPLSEKDDLSKIKIMEGSNDVTANFKTPEFINDTLIIMADTNNRVKVGSGELKTLSVQLPEDFTYTSDYGDFKVGENISHSYRINSDTTDKLTIEYSFADTNAGTFRIDGNIPSANKIEYNMGDSFTITYKLDSGYTFTGYNCNNTEVVFITPETGSGYDANGYNKTDNSVTLKVMILGDSETDVTFKLFGVKIGTCYIEIASDYGRFTTQASGTYLQGEMQALAFTADSAYQFIRWHVIDISNNRAEVTDYVKISNSTNPVTQFYLDKVPPASVQLLIEPVCAQRPKVISATPAYNASGVHRDRTLVVMFDKEIDASSIYYSEDEKTAITQLYSGHTINWLDYKLEKNPTTKKYEKTHTGSFYGYELDGEVIYKNIKITRVEDENENLLSYFMDPSLDAGNPRFLRLHVDLNNLPPIGVNLLVTLSKEVGMKQDICTELVTIKEDYVFSYRTNYNTDNDPPQVTNYTIKIGTEDTLILDKLDNSTTPESWLSDSSKLKTYNLFTSDYVNGKKERRDLKVTMTAGDGDGSGMDTIQWSITKVANPYYPLNKVGAFSYTGQLEKNTSVTNEVIEFPTEKMTEGEYSIVFYAYDLNGNFATTEPKYFIWDNTPPEEVGITYKSTKARDKIIVNTGAASKDNYKVSYKDKNDNDTQISASTYNIELALKDNLTRKHTVTMVCEDYCGNTNTYEVKLSAIPAIGMIYYKNGYWSEEYVGTVTNPPEGVICNVSSATKFYIWDIWDQYGYCWGESGHKIYTAVDADGISVYDTLIEKFGETSLIAGRGIGRNNYSIDNYNAATPKAPTIWTYVIGKNKEPVPTSSGVKTEKWFYPGFAEFAYVFDNMETMSVAYRKIIQNYGHGSSFEVVTNGETDVSKMTRILKKVNLITVDQFYWTCLLNWETIHGAPSCVAKNDYITGIGTYQQKTSTVDITGSGSNATYRLLQTVLDSNPNWKWFNMDRAKRCAEADHSTDDTLNYDMMTHAMALVTLTE